MTLVNERGAVIRLGAQLTTPGGEGTVHELASDSSLVAKIYHAPANAHKATKLQNLCRAANNALLSISAWPKELLFASHDRKTIVGFLMPRIAGKEIHQLYGPRDRQVEFPSAAWDFLIHVARNCAAAFETLHENGAIMADVNEKNLLVTRNGMVRLIDCDSYQVRNGNGHFLCDVGVPLWTPPELQTRVHQLGYNGLERTFNHDRFGLAVLIFELLFMGRHPFAGIPEGNHDLEIHEAIRRCMFAFSPKAWQLGVKAPPHTLPLGALPEKLVRLFDRAFLPGSERPNARPTGREWAHELDALHAALKTCSYDPGHKYWNGLPFCPWCQITAGGGPNFFISVAIHLGTPGATADVSAYWTTIQRVILGELMRKKPGPVQLPAAVARPMPLAKPSAPRIGKPLAPSPPASLPPPTVSPPLFPAPPELSPPAQRLKLPLASSERDSRAIGIGVLACIFGALVSAGFELLPGAFTASGGAIVLLLVWVATFHKAKEERSLRLEAEKLAQDCERREAEAAYALRLAEHEEIVRKMQEEHTRNVVKAEAAFERDRSQQEAEYRSKLNAYSAQMSLFEKAWASFEDDKRKWELESNSRTLAVDQTRRELNDATERLRITLAGYHSKVHEFSVRLSAMHEHFHKVSAEESVEMKGLEARKREAQLRQYLDTKLIRNHPIDRIRPVDAATLLAYGIESALDIVPAMKKVPGIGEVRRRNLLKWRTQCETEFRYNPNTPLPQADVQAVKLKYAQARQLALIELRGGAGTLSALESETRQTVSTLESKIAQLARAHAQALADLSECS